MSVFAPSLQGWMHAIALQQDIVMQMGMCMYDVACDLDIIGC